MPSLLSLLESNKSSAAVDREEEIYSAFEEAYLQGNAEVQVAKLQELAELFLGRGEITTAAHLWNAALVVVEKNRMSGASVIYARLETLEALLLARFTKEGRVVQGVIQERRLQLAKVRDQIRFAPIGSKSAFSAALSSLSFSLWALRVAHQSIRANSLNEFDALVGNCCCHLVAGKCYFIARRAQIDADYLRLEKIDECIASVDSLINKKVEIPKSARKMSFETFIVSQGLVPKVHEDLIFATMAHVCTKIKKTTKNNTEITDFLNIKNHVSYQHVSDLSNKRCENLITHYQRRLSQETIEFVRSQSVFLHIDDLTWARQLAQAPILKDRRGRMCTTNLYSMQVLLRSLLKDPSSLVALQIDLYCANLQYQGRFKKLFRPCDAGRTFMPLEDECVSVLRNSDHPVLVVSGCRHNDDCKNSEPNEIGTKIISGYDLLEIVLLNNLSYPEYPGELSKNNTDCKESKIADRIGVLKGISGFSLTDPSQLCLAHIHAESASSIYQSDKAPYQLPEYEYAK